MYVYSVESENTTICITKNSRQYRTINGYRLCRTPSLHIFRHPVQISFDRRKPACTQFMQSDDKSVCPKVSFCFSAKHCQLLRNRCTISPPRTNPPTTALSLSLFVGERACPSRNITAIIKNRLEESLHHLLTPHQPSHNRTIPIAFRRGAGLPLPKYN